MLKLLVVLSVLMFVSLCTHRASADSPCDPPPTPPCNPANSYDPKLKKTSPHDTSPNQKRLLCQIEHRDTDDICIKHVDYICTCKTTGAHLDQWCALFTDDAPVDSNHTYNRYCIDESTNKYVVP